MTIAALVISIVAILIAAASGWFTLRQARAAEATDQRDRLRHLAEREPKLTGSIESVNNGGWWKLNLRLTEGNLLAEVSLTIVEGDGVEFAGNQLGVPGPAPRPTAVTVKALKRGAAATWRVLLSGDRSRQMRLTATCRGEGGETWEVPVWVDLPVAPASRSAAPDTPDRRLP